MVEFALVVPLLVVILFAIIEFGRLWMTMNVLTSAAREGARVAAVSASNMNAARAAAQSVLNGAQISGATITISGPNAANEVRVTVSLNYAPITAGLIPGLGNMTLSRTATMHWEN